jgi:hypothetical protein
MVQSVKRRNKLKKFKSLEKTQNTMQKHTRLFQNLANFSNDFGCWVEGQFKIQFISSTLSIHHIDERIEIDVQMQCRNAYPSHNKNPNERLLWLDTPLKTLSNKWERFNFGSHFLLVEPL